MLPFLMAACWPARRFVSGIASIEPVMRVRLSFEGAIHILDHRLSSTSVLGNTRPRHAGELRMRKLLAKCCQCKRLMPSVRRGECAESARNLSNITAAALQVTGLSVAHLQHIWVRNVVKLRHDACSAACGVLASVRLPFRKFLKNGDLFGRLARRS